MAEGPASVVAAELERLLARDSVWSSPRDRVRAITLRGWQGQRPGGLLTAKDADWAKALRAAVLKAGGKRA